MHKYIRIAVIAIAITATVNSLICMILLGSAGLGSKSFTTKAFYFLKSETTPYSQSFLEPALSPTTSISRLGRVDYVSISLWNYCFMFDIAYASKVKASPRLWCSKPSISYTFNPVDIWHLKDADSSIPVISGIVNSVESHGLKAKVIVATFILAFILAFLTLLTGMASALVPRWRYVSIATIALATTSTISLIIASSVAIETFTAIMHEVNHKFDFALFQLGTGIFVVSWLGVVFMTIAAVFWGLMLHANGEGDRQWQRAGLVTRVKSFGLGKRYAGLSGALKRESGSAKKSKDASEPKMDVVYDRQGEDADRMLMGEGAAEKDTEADVRDWSSLSGEVASGRLFDPYEPYRSQHIVPPRERGVSPSGRGVSPSRRGEN